jgi:hypothetical protein
MALRPGALLLGLTGLPLALLLPLWLLGPAATGIGL